MDKPTRREQGRYQPPAESIQTTDHVDRYGNTPKAKRKRLAPWAAAVWLIIWQLASLFMGSELLLPGPVGVACRLANDLVQPAFWGRIGFSLGRIVLGVAIGWVVGAGCAAIAARHEHLRALIAVPMALARSVPVASFIVLALIWLSASNLAALVVALVVTPVVYENLVQALDARDAELAEMAQVLHVSRWRRLRLVELPQLAPALYAALRLSVGTGWKAGVAAEVIGIPFGSLGEAIYQTKVHFDTTGLFSWTVAVVICSILCERVALLVIRLLIARATEDADVPTGQRCLIACSEATSSSNAPSGQRYHPARAPRPQLKSAGFNVRTPASEAPRLPDELEDNPPHGITIRLEHVTKRFTTGAGPVDVSFTVRPGHPIAMMAPSGYGKTTLLRIIAGLTTPDEGAIVVVDDMTRDITMRVSIVFQTPRLCPQASALSNVRLALPTGSSLWRAAPQMLALLGIDTIRDRAAHRCSGGEKQRTAIARALITPHNILLLDEPFAGLDDSTRSSCAAIIRSHAKTCPVVIATHREEEARLIGARIIHLDPSHRTS